MLFESAPPAAASDGKIGAGRGKLLILRRLTRDGSRDADRLLAAYSPGPPRAEPLLWGSFREKADYSNLNRDQERMPVFREIGRAHV